MVICMAIGILMWYPFIKVADNKEYRLEMELAKKEQTETAAEKEAEAVTE